MDDFCNFIFKTNHVIRSVSASPLSSEKFCVLITLDNSQILAYWKYRYGGTEILHLVKQLVLFEITEK